MPPNIAMLRPTPTTLDLIDKALTTTSNMPPETRALHIVTLCSVAHHPTVKRKLAAVEHQPLLRVIALHLLQRDRYALESRYDALSMIGELCRREHRADVVSNQGHVLPADDANQRAQYFAEYFLSMPFFRSALNDVSNEVEDEDVQMVAKDILAALPSATEEWSRTVKERCKDLMFLDGSFTAPRGKQHPITRYTPMVSRSTSDVCSNCQKHNTTSAALLVCSQCQAVFYCDASCQKVHWQEAHRAPCAAFKGRRAAFEAAEKQQVAAVVVPLEPALFYETRPFIYQCRPEALQSIGYEAFFMEFQTPLL